MVKKDLETKLSDYANGGLFITKKQIGRAMNLTSYDPINALVKDIEAYNGRLYFIPDVADAIIRGAQYSNRG